MTTANPPESIIILDLIGRIKDKLARNEQIKADVAKRVDTIKGDKA